MVRSSSMKKALFISRKPPFLLLLFKRLAGGVATHLKEVRMGFVTSQRAIFKLRTHLFTTEVENGMSFFAEIAERPETHFYYLVATSRSESPPSRRHDWNAFWKNSQTALCAA